ncbi:MAG: acetylglutamate kinase [Deltaproteobacteria bacterium]|nr:acetylglutamate kinase [Deltaproteobacteria bacterium]
MSSLSKNAVQELINRASTLMEALPYIRQFYGKVFVIKYGGHAMVDEELKESFAKDIIMMRLVGMVPIVVHGGGPQIGQVMERMGLESKFHEGIRITDQETMDVVEMVLVGKVGKAIVSLINQHGGKAIGLSGKDGKLLEATKVSPGTIKNAEGINELIDLGRVGEITCVHTQVLELLEKDQFIPVIAPVGVSESGEALNINADLVASALAGALKAEKLILLTDVEGVKNKQGELLSQLKPKQALKLIEDQTISGGMIPKVKCCLQALKEGVRSAHIIDGRLKHAVLLETLTDKGVGTVFFGEKA